MRRYTLEDSGLRLDSKGKYILFEEAEKLLDDCQIAADRKLIDLNKAIVNELDKACRAAHYRATGDIK